MSELYFGFLKSRYLNIANVSYDKIEISTMQFFPAYKRFEIFNTVYQKFLYKLYK